MFWSAFFLCSSYSGRPMGGGGGPGSFGLKGQGGVIYRFGAPRKIGRKLFFVNFTMNNKAFLFYRKKPPNSFSSGLQAFLIRPWNKRTSKKQTKYQFLFWPKYHILPVADMTLKSQQILVRILRYISDLEMFCHHMLKYLPDIEDKRISRNAGSTISVFSLKKFLAV